MYDIVFEDPPADNDLDIPEVDKSDPTSEHFNPEAIAEDFTPRPFTCMFWPGW